MKYKLNALLSLFIFISPFVRADMDSIHLERTETGHFMMDASINGKAGQFILDTGATGSIVDLNKLSHFNIPIPNRAINGVTIGDEEKGQQETYPVNIESFMVENHVLSLTNIFSNSTSQLGANIDGIIGYDALAELNGLIDVSHHTLLIPDSADDVKAFIESAGAHYSAISLIKTDMGFTLVKAKLGQQDVVLLVDSGASQTVLDTKTADSLGFKLVNHPKAKSILHDGTEVPMKVIQETRLEIANVNVEGDFFTTDFGALKQMLGNKYGVFIGILGNKELAAMNGIIDVSNQAIYLR